MAESLPNERAVAKVMENIVSVKNNKSCNNNNTKQVQNNISKGLLTVIDSDSIYQDNASGKDIEDFLHSNISTMQRKLQHKTKGAMIFNTPNPFFKRDKYDLFMTFEEKVGKTLPENVGLICWYKEIWLHNLSFAYIIHLLSDHKYPVHSDWKYKKWDINKIIDLVAKGVYLHLGEGSAILLFQTMESSYKLKQDTIAYRPATFEDTLKRLLGMEDAKSTINSILEEIIREVAFTLESSSISSIGSGSNSSSNDDDEADDDNYRNSNTGYTMTY
jgi:hypothetical protein